MADGFRFPQQSAGNYYYPHNTQPNHPRHQIIRNGTPPNNIRSAFGTDTPSPSRSPVSRSPAQNLYGMFNQGHQQGQHGRVNGGPVGRGIGMLYNFQHQNAHQQQHAQHHPNLDQNHTAHATNGLNHHSSYSSGVLSNSTPSFTPNSLQNGHSAATRGGQAQAINEHWAEQLKLHKESKEAHSAMVEQGAPNHFARMRAGENKGIQPSAPAPEPPNPQEDGDAKDPARMSDAGVVRRQDWENLDLSGQGLRVLAPALFKYSFLGELYIASNKIGHLPPSIGELRHLRHLDASNNQLTELPPELGMCVYMKHLLVFDNDIRTMPSELGSLFQLEVLGIEGNPRLDPAMRQEIMEKGSKSLITLLREQAPVPMPPTPRALLEFGDSAAATSLERFKIYSFNILSDQACTPRLYGYSPSAALSWEYRKEQILQEIQTQDADIVCLQEIDTDTFKEYFSMKLAYADYKGVFWPRSRAKTMSEKDAKTVDGCATFYKGSKFILLDKQIIEFANIAINRADMKNQHDTFNRIMPRDHIGVVTFLENRQTGSRVMVVNTHIFWDPVYADVKLIQSAILMESVNKWAEKYAKWPACKDKKHYALANESDGETPDEPIPEPAPSKEYSSNIQIPLVICSDLNSTADSSVYELFSKGSVKPDHKELGTYKYGNFTKNGMEHPFQLRSAYTNLDKTPDALEFTNYTPGFRGVIDHIWYSTNALENTSLLGPVDPEYMKTVPGFPNYHFPSDHLSLMAEFQFKGRKEKKSHPDPDFGPSSRSQRRND